MNKLQLTGVMDRYNSGLIKLIKKEADEEIDLSHLKVDIKSMQTQSPQEYITVVGSALDQNSMVSTHSLLKSGYNRRLQNLNAGKKPKLALRRRS